MRKELEARTDCLVVTLDGARCEVPWDMAEGLADTLEGDCYEWELYRGLYVVNVGDQVSIQPASADAALLPREEAMSLAGGVRKMMASYEAWRLSQ